MIFRSDRVTVIRRVAEVIKNEITYTDEVVYSNIPCHLSVSSNSAINQSQSTASVLYDYTLFINNSQNVIIEPNDKLQVTLHSGKVLKLRAGESHRYYLTTQTNCESNDIV